MVSSVSNPAAATSQNQAASVLKSQQLNQADFLKLLTTQMTTQDPTDPVDNKEMVAQMAQFSSLSAATETSDTLKTIASKLDVLISQSAPGASATNS